MLEWLVSTYGLGKLVIGLVAVLVVFGGAFFMAIARRAPYEPGFEPIDDDN